MAQALLTRKKIDPKLPREERKRLEKIESKRLRTLARRLQEKSDIVMGAAYKPVAEWDDEELARGRPRDPNGGFRGPPPSWVNRTVHEEAITRFTDVTKRGLHGLVPKAIKAIDHILTCEATDERGRPVIPAGVRLDAAKWTVEHLVGKAVQPVDVDISVKLNGILAHALVNPNDPEALAEAQAQVLAQSSGMTMPTRAHGVDHAIEASSHAVEDED